MPTGKLALCLLTRYVSATLCAEDLSDLFQRGSMLGETPLPSQPRSVFDFMSQKDRERLQNIKNATLNAPSQPPAAVSAPAPPQPRLPGQIEIPSLHPSVAKAALSGFQPFTADPVKQSRYAAFLNYQASRENTDGSSGLGIGPMPGQSTEEFNKELEDYAKSATVFKPLSGAMAGRFRSAVVIESGPKIVEGLHQPVAVPEPSAAELEEREREREDADPKMGAVRMGLYGPLTREVKPWQPARLLCKRFGVKDPEVDMTGEAGAATADLAMPTAAEKEADGGSAAPESNSVSAGAITDGSEAATASSERRNGPRDLANVGLGEDEDQGRDTLTYERPSMDIFKAIFASDDEGSDDEDGEAEQGLNNAVSTPSNGAEPKVDLPSHLAVADMAPPTYQPENKGSTDAVVTEKIDLASFKPTFVPRADRESRKEKTKDKKDKKKKSKALLTFNVDEDGEDANLGAPTLTKPKAKRKDRDKEKGGEREKKKRKEHKEAEDDDSMWVEAPLPDAVKSIPTEVVPSISPRAMQDVDMRSPSQEETKSTRTRKRAVDFM